MKLILSFFTLLLLSSHCVEAKSAPDSTESKKPKELTISIKKGERQTLEGFGASILDSKGKSYAGAGFPDDIVNETHRQMWQELDFNIMRMWIPMNQYAPEPKKRDLYRAFEVNYLPVIKKAQKFGMNRLLIAPAPPSWIHKKGEDWTDKKLQAYANLIAEFIDQVRRKHGIYIELTGIANEPGRWKFGKLSDKEQLDVANAQKDGAVKLVILLREALDKKRLPGVKIIAPETANVDWTFYGNGQQPLRGFANTFKNSPKAWEALYGLGFHSYSMSMNSKGYAYVKNTNKRLWQTESSRPGPEMPGNTTKAAQTAARVINDLNYGTTAWIHFIGFANRHGDARKGDNGTRIMALDPKAKDKDDMIIKFDKYYYLKQLTQAFSRGSVFRLALTNHGTGQMWLTQSGEQERSCTYSTGARNVDGSWGLAVLNFTNDKQRCVYGSGNKNGTGWHRRRGAEHQQITLDVEELRNVPNIKMRVWRSNHDKLNVEQKPVILKYGKVTLNVAPYELVTLRSYATQKSFVDDKTLGS